jgi:hypothetical protein
MISHDSQRRSKVAPQRIVFTENDNLICCQKCVVVGAYLNTRDGLNDGGLTVGDMTDGS